MSPNQVGGETRAAAGFGRQEPLNRAQQHDVIYLKICEGRTLI